MKQAVKQLAVIAIARRGCRRGPSRRNRDCPEGLPEGAQPKNIVELVYSLGINLKTDKLIILTYLIKLTN